MHRAAAYGDHLQLIAELERDLVAIFGQNGERAGADIAQPDNADVDLLHICFMIAAGIRRHSLLRPQPSGYEESEVMSKVNGGRAAGFLQKPFTAGRLEKIRQAWLHR